MSTIIQSITAQKIFNIRGEETIEINVKTENGFGRASAPSGASRGKGEVVPYPEGGVDQAIERVRELVEPQLAGVDAQGQEKVDLLLNQIDGTQDFRKIGGNTSYAVSLATAEAAASSLGRPLFTQLGGQLTSELPHPLGNVIGGGKHARGKSPDIQEFLVLPVKVNTFLDAAKANILVHQRVGSYLLKKDKTFTGGRGDEGAWAPNLRNEDALEIVTKACEEVSDETGIKCRVGLDMAASSLWNLKKECYVYPRDKVDKDSGEQLEFVLDLVRKYKLAYVEDPLHEEDFENFAELTKKVKKCLICGDDLFVTNKERLAYGIEKGVANAIIIKGNQVGTLTDAWETTILGQRAEYVTVMSHRSGETTEAHIAHLAVAFRCPIIKAGVVEGARIAIINELIRIERILEERAKMAITPL
ncbi:MAG: phosphopyruvate hydratase [Candidatus Bathyarchaeota archaeon]